MSKKFNMDEFMKELGEIEIPTNDEIKKLRKAEPKFSKEFEDYFSQVIGKGFNFTRNELEQLKWSLNNTIKRWRIKGIVGKDELPDTGSKLIWSWKMSVDKDQTTKMVKSISKRINNYRRKMFGTKDNGANEPYIAHMVDIMMREGFPIRYPDQELIDRFFRGGDLEGIE